MSIDDVIIDKSLFEGEIPTAKVYKDRAIWVGSFVGGPLVAGYLIGENFKVFNQPDKFKVTWIVAVITTIVIFGGIFLIPDPEKIPKQVIPLFYTAVAFYLVKHYQNEKIIAHIDAGGKLYGWWRVIGISFIGLIITMLPIFSVALLEYGKASSTETTKAYGIMKHEIAFDKSNISEIEVDKLAVGLTTTTFFDDAVQKYAYAKKVGSVYEISLSCDASVSKDPDALAPFIQLRDDMQKLFPNNKIIFDLVVDDLNNVVKRIE